ncbi:MAG: hypothetical protein WCI89_00010 [bacterium]
MKETFTKKGFTRHSAGFMLIEVVIYIGLFGIIMIGASVAAFQLLDGGARNERAVAVQEEATFLNRKINWALAGAITASTNPSGTTLTVLRPDLRDSSPLVFTAHVGTITLARGTGVPVPLSGNVFPITGVVFVVAAAGGSTVVSASFSIQNTPFIFKTYLH